MSAEESILSNTTLWYSVSAAIFFVAMIKMGRKPIVSMLDDGIAKIKAELEQATQLRLEAEKALEDYREREKVALKEAADIVAQAQRDADHMRAEAKAEIDHMLTSQEEKAVMRIQAAQDEAIAEIREILVHQAIEKAQKALIQRLDDATLTRLVDESIAEAVQHAPQQRRQG